MIILIGASASGKTEVAKILQTKYNLVKAITHTSRGIRIGETNAIDYFFVTSDDFKKLSKEDFFVETTKYNDNYYGTSKSQIADDKVLILDPNGLESFRLQRDKNIVSFLFQVDQITRYNRMIQRGDDMKAAQRRITNDQNKFSLSSVGKTNFVIDSENFTLEEVADKIYELYMFTIRK